MTVMVRYDDESYDIVEDYCLEYLIRTGNITEFCRTDRWLKADSLKYDVCRCGEMRMAKLSNGDN